MDKIKCDKRNQKIKLIMLIIYIPLICFAGLYNGIVLYWLLIGGNLIWWHELIPYEFNALNIWYPLISLIYIIFSMVFILLLIKKKRI